jgi:hypothetical protein
MSDDPKPPILDYAQPPKPSTRRVAWEIFGGILGYLGMLMIVIVVLGRLDIGPEWLVIPLIIFVPVASMLLLSYWLKSQVMMIAVAITFGVVFLSCGTCVAL